MYSRGLYNDRNYPYYHELQLPTINDYYYKRSKLDSSNENKGVEDDSVRPKTCEKYVTNEQFDLNAAYKSDRRSQRTSYNANFLNIDEYLAGLRKNYEKRVNFTSESAQRKEKEDTFKSQSLYPTKLNNWFSQNQGNNANDFITPRKSFWRPKTPGVTLDARRKNLPSTLDQKYNTVTKIENISKRTDDMIERFRKKYDN
jgi:hypothetical protein